MSEQGPIAGGPQPARSSRATAMLAAFSAVGLIGFVVTFVFVMMRTAPDSQAAAPATFAQRVVMTPGATGPAGNPGAAGPAGPVGPRGPAGDPGIRIVRNDCGTATCSAECAQDEMVLTAYCGPNRTQATYNSDREAMCRLPQNARRIDVVAACVKITRR